MQTQIVIENHVVKAGVEGSGLCFRGPRCVIPKPQAQHTGIKHLGPPFRKEQDEGSNIRNIVSHITKHQ
jgi:hypothetical protein